MITGREPNIVARMAPAEQAKVLARERRAIARRELDEQKSFAAILRKLEKRGALHYVWPRSDKRSTIAPGHPDFSVWLAGGRTALFEFKLASGRFSEEQEKTIELLSSLGHYVWVVGSALEAERIITTLLNITLQTYGVTLYDQSDTIQTNNQAAVLLQEGTAGVAPGRNVQARAERASTAHHEPRALRAHCVPGNTQKSGPAQMQPGKLF